MQSCDFRILIIIYNTQETRYVSHSRSLETSRALSRLVLLEERSENARPSLSCTVRQRLRPRGSRDWWVTRVSWRSLHWAQCVHKASLCTHCYNDAQQCVDSIIACTHVNTVCLYAKFLLNTLSPWVAQCSNHKFSTRSCFLAKFWNESANSKWNVSTRNILVSWFLFENFSASQKFPETHIYCLASNRGYLGFLNALKRLKFLNRCKG